MGLKNFPGDALKTARRIHRSGYAQRSGGAGFTESSEEELMHSAAHNDTNAVAITIIMKVLIRTLTSPRCCKSSVPSSKRAGDPLPDVSPVINHNHDRIIKNLVPHDTIMAERRAQRSRSLTYHKASITSRVVTDPYRWVQSSPGKEPSA